MRYQRARFRGNPPCHFQKTTASDAERRLHYSRFPRGATAGMLPMESAEPVSGSPYGRSGDVVDLGVPGSRSDGVSMAR